MRPAEAFKVFAADSEGQNVASQIHEELRKQDIWVWKGGDIDHHLGIPEKGEVHWVEYRHRLDAEGQSAIADMPTIAELVGWVAPRAAPS